MTAILLVNVIDKPVFPGTNLEQRGHQRGPSRVQLHKSVCGVIATPCVYDWYDKILAQQKNRKYLFPNIKNDQ